MSNKNYDPVEQQNAALRKMLNKYQLQIVPKYEEVLELARAELEALTKAVVKLTQEKAHLLGYVKTLRGCNACKHLHGPAPEECPGGSCSRCKEDCACQGCDEQSKWQWEGLREHQKGG